MTSRARTALLIVGACGAWLTPLPVEAQWTTEVVDPREDGPVPAVGRGHAAFHPSLALGLSGGGIFAGAGLSAGLDLIVHVNHSMGLRVFAAWYPWSSSSSTDAHYAGVALYRFHDNVRVGRWAPWVEVGVGAGVWSGCVAGDYCGGFGAVVLAGGGVEWAPHARFALVLGAQVLLQAGMVNGVDLMLVPSLLVGLRAG